MASNHKLTGVLKGRAISGTSNANDLLTITFEDGSTMTVKNGGREQQRVYRRHNPGRTAAGYHTHSRLRGGRLAHDLPGGGDIERPGAGQKSRDGIRRLRQSVTFPRT